MRKILMVWWRWRNRAQFAAEVRKLAKAINEPGPAGTLIPVTTPKGYTFHEVCQAAKEFMPS